MAGAAKRERDLSEQQNEHVRTLVRELLKKKGETQRSLAPKLGMGQPGLSGFLAGRQGTSYSAARRAAQLAGVNVDDVLAGLPLDLDPYPLRSRVLALLGSDAHPAAVTHVRAIELDGDAASPSAIEWARMLAYWDAEARAGRIK